MTCYLTLPGLSSISGKWGFKKSLIRLWQGLMHVTCLMHVTVLETESTREILAIIIPPPGSCSKNLS